MRSSKVLILVEGAIMVALATILSFIRIYKLPWGGSITAVSMLPIALFSIRRGVKKGLAVSLLFALIQFFQGIMDGLFGWGLTPTMLIACILLDYILAFTVLGFAGILRKKGVGGWVFGVVFAILLRFGCHFASGVIIWKSFGQLWGDFFTENTVLYSLCYNGAYMLPELVSTTFFAVLLLKLPGVGKYLAKPIDSAN